MKKGLVGLVILSLMTSGAAFGIDIADGVRIGISGEFQWTPFKMQFDDGETWKKGDPNGTEKTEGHWDDPTSSTPNWVPETNVPKYRTDDNGTHDFQMGTWGEWKTTVTFEAENSSKTAGVRFEVQANQNRGGSNPFYGYGDQNAQVWVKPFKWLVLRGGEYDVTDFAEKAGGEIYDFADGGITNAFAYGNSAEHFGTGLYMGISPLKSGNLVFAAGVGSVIGGGSNEGGAVKDGALAVLATGQYGIGYTIPNVGFIRAEYLGGCYGYDQSRWLNDTRRWQAVSAQFTLTAVKNLTIEAGAKVPLKLTIDEELGDFWVSSSTDGGLGNGGGFGDYFGSVKNGSTLQAPVWIGAGVKYNMGEYMFRTRFLGKFFGETFDNSGATDVTTKYGSYISIAAMAQRNIPGGYAFIYFGFDHTAADEKDGTAISGVKNVFGVGATAHKDIGPNLWCEISVQSRIAAGSAYDAEWNDNNADLGKARQNAATTIVIPFIFGFSL
jgi:hypothetical protein